MKGYEEEDVSSYWMTLRKREDTEIKRGITRLCCGELVLEEAIGLS